MCPSDHSLLTLKRKAGNLSSGLVEHFERLIKNGTMAVQQKLPSEMEIMQEYGVSRTVVREALSRLQALGLVQTRQGVGTFVLPVEAVGGSALPSAESRQDVLAVMEVRVSLETEGAAFAAQRRTPAQLAEMRVLMDSLVLSTARGEPSQELDQRLHLLIVQATGNRYMIDIMGCFTGGLVPRMRLNASYLESGRSAHFLQRRDAEHEEIVAAIARQDPSAAGAAMRLHLINSRERLMEIFGAVPA